MVEVMISFLSAIKIKLIKITKSIYRYCINFINKKDNK